MAVKKNNVTGFERCFISTEAIELMKYKDANETVFCI